jgi:hypothetical protein
MQLLAPGSGTPCQSGSRSSQLAPDNHQTFGLSFCL